MKDSDWSINSLAAVRAVLDKKQVRYTTELYRPEIRAVRAVYRMGEELVTVHIFLEPSPGVCRMDVICPVTYEKKYQGAVCSLIADENRVFRFGSLVYDPRDGEIAFRYSYPTGAHMDEEDFLMVYEAVLTSALHSFRRLITKLSPLSGDEIDTVS